MIVLRRNFGEIKIHENYMIVQFHEGEVVDKSKHAILEDLANTYFNDKPFIYITHRINSYAVDPSVYKETSQIKNLIGFCVVSSNFMAKSNTQIEKLFLTKPLEVFDTLPEAIEWADALIENH